MYKHICTSRKDGEDTNEVVQEFQNLGFLGQAEYSMNKDL